MAACMRQSMLPRIAFLFCCLYSVAFAYRESRCRSFGIDFQDGGSYFVDSESNDNFTAYSTFEGCNIGSYVQTILVMPDGDQIDCGYTNSGRSGINRLTTCPILENDLVTGDYSLLILGDNGDGFPVANQRQFHVDVGPQATYTFTPTVTFTLTKTPAGVKLATSTGFSTSTTKQTTTVPVSDAEIDLYVYPEPLTTTVTSSDFSTYTHYQLTDVVIYALETPVCLIPDKQEDPPVSTSAASSSTSASAASSPSSTNSSLKTSSAGQSNSSGAAAPNIVTVTVTDIITVAYSSSCSTKSSSTSSAGPSTKTVTVDLTTVVGYPSNFTATSAADRTISLLSSSIGLGSSAAPRRPGKSDTTDYMKPKGVHGPATKARSKTRPRYNPLTMSPGATPHEIHSWLDQQQTAAESEKPSRPQMRIKPAQNPPSTRTLPRPSTVWPGEDDPRQIHPTPLLPYTDWPAWQVETVWSVTTVYDRQRLAKRGPDAPTITVTADHPFTVNETVYASTTSLSTRVSYATSVVLTTVPVTVTSGISVVTTHTLAATMQTFYATTRGSTDLTKNYTATWTKTTYTTPPGLSASCRSQGGHFSGMRW